MARILKTISPVDSMSGMVGKRDDFVSKKAFIINVKKVSGWKTKGAPFMYFSLRQNGRLAPLTAAEVSNQQKFKAVSQATAARLINPEYIEQDQYNFVHQDKYTSLYGYVFSVVYDSYEG